VIILQETSYLSLLLLNALYCSENRLGIACCYCRMISQCNVRNAVNTTVFLSIYGRSLNISVVFVCRMQSLSAHWGLGRPLGSPSWTTRLVTLPSSAERPASCCGSNRGSSRASGRWDVKKKKDKDKKGYELFFPDDYSFQTTLCCSCAF